MSYLFSEVLRRIGLTNKIAANNWKEAADIFGTCNEERRFGEMNTNKRSRGN